jgi:chromosome segregation ATPase
LALAAIVVLLSLFSHQLRANDEEMEVEMGRSSPEADDLLVESTPMKPHENIFIEDVEAQLKETKEEAKSAQLEVKKSEERLKKVKSKNYGDKKKLQIETISALERKKKADVARAKIEKQREHLQRDVLALEKRRMKAKERAAKSEEAIETAKIKLHDAKKDRVAAGASTKAPASRPKKKYRKVKVNFKNADAY